jgi:hypothetical protein
MTWEMSFHQDVHVHSVGTSLIIVHHDYLYNYIVSQEITPNCKFKIANKGDIIGFCLPDQFLPTISYISLSIRNERTPTIQVVIILNHTLIGASFPISYLSNKPPITVFPLWATTIHDNWRFTIMRCHEDTGFQSKE